MALTIGAIAIINALGYLAVIYAFRASFRKLDTATWWFALGFGTLAVTIILRGVYWDVGLPLARAYHPEAAREWVEAVSGRMINIVFNLALIFAFYCALKCRQMMIPEEERHLWPWWKAWLHPKTLGVLRWHR